MRSFIFRYLIFGLWVLVFLFQGTELAAQNPNLAEYQRLARKYKEAGNNRKAAEYLTRIAFVHWRQGGYSNAISSFDEAIAYHKKTRNLNAVKTIYTDISTIYSEQGNFDQALDYAQKSLDARRQIGKKPDISSGLIDLATIYESKKQYNKAIENLNQALEIAAELNNHQLMKNCHGLLAQNYKKLGNSDKSQFHFDKYSVYSKYVQEQEFKQKEEKQREKIREVNAKVRETEYELREKTNILESAKDSLERIEELSQQKQEQINMLTKDKAMQDLLIKQKEAQLKKEATIRYMFIAVIGLILVLVFVMYRANQLRKRNNAILEMQNKEIQHQNKEIAKQRDAVEKKSLQLEDAFQKIQKQNLDITNSINYAQRIQEAMLPGESVLRGFLPESFILFKPRNVVSGDFYWFKEVQSMAKVTKFLLNDSNGVEDEKRHDAQSKNLVIAAIDCTGHGVPGAFMSMIGFNLLNEITGRGVKSANIILNNLHRAVRSALHQDTTDNRDGMDMALCVIDKQAKTLDFSGAKNPLVYIQNGQVNTIKGDKYPIGGIQREEKRRFSHEKISVEIPTTIYIFSDGFQDQFGGPKGRKFMKKRFRELLLEIYQKPMSEQKQILDKTFEDWKGDNKQVDDVLVMGFRLNF